MKAFRLCLFLAIVASIFAVSSTEYVESISGQIYKTFTHGYPCTRWLHTTGQVGCSSQKGGVSGHLVPLNSTVDVAAFIAKKLSGGYVAVLSPNAFTLQTILLLETGPVVGAVVLDPAVFPGEPVQPFSPQTHFPQESSSIHEAHTDWNPAGQSMLSHDFKFPVYNLNAQDSATVWEKANDNRVNDGTWGAELSTFMWAGGNAEICLRRKYCEPVGGQSVWTAFPSTIDPVKKIFVVMSSMDSASLFYGRATGADSDMSGLIVNLGTLHTLRKLEQITSHSKQFIFAFFDAEAWGYGGSKRFLHDLYNFTCIEYTDDTKTACARPYYPSLEFQKINPESIEQLLEFKQIGKLANRFPRVSVFSASTAPTPIARKIEVITKEKNQNVTMLPPLEPGRLPPSSMMSFLKVNSKWKSSASVLTDHFGAYQNQYYQSRFDDYSNIDLPQLCNVATLVARTLIELSVSSPISESLIRADCGFIEQLALCLTKNTSECVALGHEGVPFMPELANVADATPNHYSSVFNPYIRQVTPKLVHDLVYSMTATTIKTDATCESDSDCAEQKGKCIATRCMNSNTFYHDALATGIKRNYDADIWEIVDPSQPNWVEPYWGGFSIKMYQSGGTTSSIIFLVVAIVESILAIICIMMCMRMLPVKFKTV